MTDTQSDTQQPQETPPSITEAAKVFLVDPSSSANYIKAVDSTVTAAVSVIVARVEKAALAEGA